MKIQWLRIRDMVQTWHGIHTRELVWYKCTALLPIIWDAVPLYLRYGASVSEIQCPCIQDTVPLYLRYSAPVSKIRCLCIWDTVAQYPRYSGSVSEIQCPPISRYSSLDVTSGQQKPAQFQRQNSAILLYLLYEQERHWELPFTEKLPICSE